MKVMESHGKVCFPNIHVKGKKIKVADQGPFKEDTWLWML